MPQDEEYDGIPPPSDLDDMDDQLEDDEDDGGHPSPTTDREKARLRYIAQQEKADFIDLGRVVQRTIVAWTPLHTIFYEGLIRVTTYLACNPISDRKPLSPEAIGIPEAGTLRQLKLEDVHTAVAEDERDRLYSLFCRIYRVSPKLCMKIVEAEARFNKFVGYVSTGAGNARSTDLRAVRVLVMEWGSLKKVAKAGRGFHHPFTAGLLMPCDQNPADEELIEAFQKDPRLAFPQHAEPPRLLYGGDLSRSVNLDAANSIILRNPYLLAAWCRVYQSDDSAIDVFTDEGKGDLSTLRPTADSELVQARISGNSRSVGHTTGVTTTTPHTVGYVACLLRAALSSDEKLTGEIDDPEIAYNYSALYAEVVQTMSMTNNPAINAVVKSIVEWWDRHAFPRNQLRNPASLNRLTMQERMAIEAQAATAVSGPPPVVSIPAEAPDTGLGTVVAGRTQDPSSAETSDTGSLIRRDGTTDDEENVDGGEMEGDASALNGLLEAV